MWAEPEPGPSRRAAPSRQGYCGYCRVLYSNLDQHLSSLRHLDAVRSSSRGSGAAATASSGRSRLTLLERFLQDVLLHHPHRYHDNRPSHADLPAVSAPPPPRAELDELRCSDDSRSLGTREHPPSSERSANQPPDSDHDDHGVLSQSGEAGVQERLSAPMRAQDRVTPPTETSHAQSPPPLQQATPDRHQATPPRHRKAHRKTNRRKTSDSSGSSRHRGDTVDRTIEEVIQTCCHDLADDTDSFHFSLPVTMETQSEEWDSPVQVVLQRPVMAAGGGGRSLDPLTGTQVRLDDQQLYSHRLHATLLGGERREGGVATVADDDELPESFRGKSREQLEREDEEKVDELVRQFRRERFVCYFDSESLARYGRRSHRKKRRGDDQGEEPQAAVLPLLDHDDHESAYERRRRRRRGRGFRMASRCQVVKVSHATQTVRLVVPSVRQNAPEATPPGTAPANQSAAERTPKTQPWRRLPASYCDIITPLQPRTSLVYLLCSPSAPAPSLAAGSASRRSRKKRRPLDLQGLKVKYKRLPVRFYDPGANRILKAPPRGHAPSPPPPPCVRQLFRSLSPDLNSDRAPGEGPKDAARGRGQRGRAARRERTRSLATRKRTRAQATPRQATPPPPPPRREGLRRHTPTGPASTTPHAPGVRRGRGRRGRGCERGRR